MREVDTENGEIRKMKKRYIGKMRDMGNKNYMLRKIFWKNLKMGCFMEREWKVQNKLSYFTFMLKDTQILTLHLINQ